MTIPPEDVECIPAERDRDEIAGPGRGATPGERFRDDIASI
jgi:hypothetical protein